MEEELIPGISNKLSEERRRIDCVENNAVIFNIYQKLVMCGKNIADIVGMHLYDIIRINDIKHRHCRLSMLYTILKQQGIPEEDLSDLAAYLNDRPIYKQFKLVFTEDILDPVSRGRVALNRFGGTTSYKYFKDRFELFYEYFENYLQSILVAYTGVRVNSWDAESAQSYVNYAWENLVKIAVEDEFHEILNKLQLFRKITI